DVDWKLRGELFVAQYHRDIARYDAGLNPNVRKTYDAALQTPLQDLAIAKRAQMELFQTFQAIFDDFDLLICPGVSVPPFPWREPHPQAIDGQPVRTYMEWLGLTAALTVVGHPVVALPCGRDADGTPFGIQVVGRNFADAFL